MPVQYKVEVASPVIDRPLKDLHRHHSEQRPNRMKETCRPSNPNTQNLTHWKISKNCTSPTPRDWHSVPMSPRQLQQDRGHVLVKRTYAPSWNEEGLVHWHNRATPSTWSIREQWDKRAPSESSLLLPISMKPKWQLSINVPALVTVEPNHRLWLKRFPPANRIPANPRRFPNHLIRLDPPESKPVASLLRRPLSHHIRYLKDELCLPRWLLALVQLLLDLLDSHLTGLEAGAVECDSWLKPILYERKLLSMYLSYVL